MIKPPCSSYDHSNRSPSTIINSSSMRNPLTESTDVLERLMSQRNPATRFVESEKITVRKGRKVKNLSIRTKSNTAWRKTIGISQTLFSAVNQEREKLQKIAQVWLILYESYLLPITIQYGPYSWLLDDEKHEDTLRRANRKTKKRQSFIFDRINFTRVQFKASNMARWLGTEWWSFRCKGPIRLAD